MKYAAERARSHEAIDLAAVPDFVLGALRVQPSMRRVSSGGREESVEPRVMQALIALAEAGETVVSRDALIDRCWGGRIVGDDAINRCIAKVRRLANIAEPPAFIVETVSKVGYVLVVPAGAAVASAAIGVLPPQPAEASDAPSGHPEGQVRRWLPAGRGVQFAAVLMLVAVAAAAVLWRPASPLDRSFNPPPHSVAILAFANMSGDPAQEYFSDGLSEELIDLLSRVRPLHVVGRTSSFSFKGKPATIGEIARTLNVGAVLEGSVRRQGTKLRITAELNDAKTGYQLWARSFDRDQGDLLHVQTEIASDVAAALQVTLLDDEAAKLAQGGTQDPNAFDEYLRGVRALRENTIESYHAAIAHFDIAIRIDPGFALAYSGRANAESFLAIVGPGFETAHVHRMFVDALASADRGVALAPGVGETHAARGFVLSKGLLNYTRGLEELTVAQAEAPGNATIEMIYANVAISVGRVQEALAAAHRAVTLDPLRQDTWGCLAFILFQARDYTASIDALQHARSVASIFPPQFVFEVGLSLLMQGKAEAARQTCATTPEWEGSECLAVVYHALGKKAEALAELAKLRAVLGDTGSYYYACIYAQWGQPADALSWLRRAVELRDPGLAELTTDPLLDPIRGQPGFRDIQQSFSLPPK